ncbi:MAG TPA: hypothetical protein VE007_05815 [Thermoanaerobaculia bacterium]|nr:hypothetical protein [Thermoanaerobaculia bacterium]
MASAQNGGEPREMESLLEEMISSQQRRLRELAGRIAPHLTEEDLLQPHDHPEIGSHPDYQFEDGILSGYLAVRAALRARR